MISPYAIAAASVKAKIRSAIVTADNAGSRVVPHEPGDRRSIRFLTERFRGDVGVKKDQSSGSG